MIVDQVNHRSLIASQVTINITVQDKEQNLLTCVKDVNTPISELIDPLSQLQKLIPSSLLKWQLIKFKAKRWETFHMKLFGRICILSKLN